MGYRKQAIELISEVARVVAALIVLGALALLYFDSDRSVECFGTDVTKLVVPYMVLIMMAYPYGRLD